MPTPPKHNYTIIAFIDGEPVDTQYAKTLAQAGSRHAEVLSTWWGTGAVVLIFDREGKTVPLERAR